MTKVCVYIVSGEVELTIMLDFTFGIDTSSQDLAPADNCWVEDSLLNSLQGGGVANVCSKSANNIHFFITERTTEEQRG